MGHTAVPVSPLHFPVIGSQWLCDPVRASERYSLDLWEYDFYFYPLILKPDRPVNIGTAAVT